MLRQLTENEINSVAGAGIVNDVYPPIPVGSEMIGFSYQIIGWEPAKLVQVDYDLFETKKYYELMPIYDIQPIYAPKQYTIIY